ncbi:hypothetical protein K9U40_13170 [Xanthobacter autotrophicus]|uniref:hypothetical protein n=1 Tax=Xanthobacter TaxID=279 RepID=UPI0024AB2427|nr:hypothetical protein [Xanthobacter autotrophicus]MDI4665274.1 hypothetical protein [Xanthobacter autotrophicus]
MRATIRTGGLQGLAQRLAARHLPAAEAEAAGHAARELAAEITAETGAPATIAGSPRRPLVRVADPVLLARIRGALGRPGDPVLDRIRLAFARRRS